MLASRKRYFMFGVVPVFFVATAVITAMVLAGHHKSDPAKGSEPIALNDDDDAEEAIAAVRAIHPRVDPNLTISVQQILSVKPLIEADLRAQVAGVVLAVPKAEGDRVRRGEKLVLLDVPELKQEYRQKSATVLEREQEVLTAQATAENAKAQKEVAESIIPQRVAEKSAAIETRELRRIRVQRFEDAVKNTGVRQIMLDEERRDFNAANFAVDVADAAIQKAAADVKEKETAVQVAEATVKLKMALVEVARKDRDHVGALMDFAHISAPFGGEILARNVDPGALVQNASNGQSRSLMRIARTDIMTLVMKVPDDTAPYVTVGTEAEMQIDSLKGVVIRGKVTRCPKKIDDKDRTRTVEVDLFNGTQERFKVLAGTCVRTWLAPLAACDPLQAVTLEAASRERWQRDCKSINDPFPMRPIVGGKSGSITLIPGMTGYMRLNLSHYHDAPLIPESAVFTHGGKPYIMVVENDVVRQLPVRVLVDDGRVARVLVIVREEDPGKDQSEETRELATSETVVLTRQSELTDGQQVRATITSWDGSPQRHEGHKEGH